MFSIQTPINSTNPSEIFTRIRARNDAQQKMVCEKTDAEKAARKAKKASKKLSKLTAKAEKAAEKAAKKADKAAAKAAKASEGAVAGNSWLAVKPRIEAAVNARVAEEAALLEKHMAANGELPVAATVGQAPTITTTMTEVNGVADINVVIDHSLTAAPVADNAVAAAFDAARNNPRGQNQGRGQNHARGQNHGRNMQTARSDRGDRNDK